MSLTSQGRTMRCPFDPSHVMPYDRFHNHLDRCKFPDKKSYVKCKYNPYHIIHKDLIVSHENKCEDKTKFHVESDQDDWGVEPEEPLKHEKPEKSTVSTAITSKFSKSSSETKVKREQKMPDKNQMWESFDDYDFKKM